MSSEEAYVHVQSVVPEFCTQELEHAILNKRNSELRIFIVKILERIAPGFEFLGTRESLVQIRNLIKAKIEEDGQRLSTIQGVGQKNTLKLLDAIYPGGKKPMEYWVLSDSNTKKLTEDFIRHVLSSDFVENSNEAKTQLYRFVGTEIEACKFALSFIFPNGYVHGRSISYYNSEELKSMYENAFGPIEQ